MKKLALLLPSLFIFLASIACVTLEAGIERTPTPNIHLTGTVKALGTANANLATQIAAPTATPRPGAPTFSPSPSSSPVGTLEPVPVFTSLRFSTSNDVAVSDRFYPAGVNRIYAVWDYANMREGMSVQRIWTLNGAVYANRKETWDYARYGSDGTVRDVSIFDENIGIQAGEYTLDLYINGVLQDMGNDPYNQEISHFWVFPPEVRDPVASPNKTYTAFVRSAGQLVVEDPNGNTRELAVTQEISSLLWFPDERHILYEDRDRNAQIRPDQDWGISHKLWILDIVTGEQHVIGTTGEDFHSPVISPTGRFIAVLAGDTFQNNCLASPSLSIIELDSELRRQAVFTIKDFTGLPEGQPNTYGIYPIIGSAPGRWEDDDRLISGLYWICVAANNRPPDGMYLLNLTQMRAERVGDIP